MDSDLVIETVFEMQKRVVEQGATKQQLEAEFPLLKEKSPPLFDKACKPMSQAEVKVLLSMMDKLKAVNSNELSQHEGSVAVGQILVDQYIKPVVDSQRNSSAST